MIEPKRCTVPGTGQTIVEAGIKVADSEFAGTLATRNEITLDQAAALIKFQIDTDTVARLLQYAEESPEQFPHELQRQRDQRERNERVQTERTSLTEAGYTVLTPDDVLPHRHPQHRWTPIYRPVLTGSLCDPRCLPIRRETLHASQNGYFDAALHRASERQSRAGCAWRIELPAGPGSRQRHQQVATSRPHEHHPWR